MKYYVLYHGNCPDGFGAAYAAWLRFRNDAQYIPVSYGSPPPEMEAGSWVYILDFSYPTAVLMRLIEQHESVMVLDHHHTAKCELESLAMEYPAKIRFDLSKSGAVMAWEFFHSKVPVPEFFLYLQDRDLWEFKLPSSREVAIAVRSYPFEFECWEKMTGIVHQGQIYELPGILLDDLKKEGIACKRLMDQQVRNMVRCHRRVILDGKHKEAMFCPVAGEGEANGFGVTVQPDQWACPVSNASVFFSEVGEALLEHYPDAPFSAYYSDRADGRQQWGLRSRADFDCSVVARAFGGGGHKQASGFVL